MTLYIVLLFLMLYIVPNIRLHVYGHNESKKSENLSWILFMFFISFIWMYGLRDTGGVDDESYRLFYEKNYGGSIFESFFNEKEPFFNLVKIIGYSLNLNYKFLFIGHALMDVLFLILAFRNYFNTKSVLVIYIASFFLIAFPGIFTIMRQGCAMTILFYLYSLDKPTWKTRIFFWLLILCCHYGFIMLLPFEIVASARNYNFNKYIKIVIPLICLVLGNFFGLNRSIMFITKTIGMYNYMNSNENYNYSTEIGVVTWCMYIAYLFVVCHKQKYSKFMSKLKKHIYDKVTYGSMMYFSLIFLARNTRWGNRIGTYYLLFVTMLIPLICEYEFVKLKTKEKLLLRYIVTTVLFLTFIWYMKNLFGDAGYVWSIKFR